MRTEARRPERDRRERRAAQRNMPEWQADGPVETAALLSFPVADRLAWSRPRRK